MRRDLNLNLSVNQNIKKKSNLHLWLPFLLFSSIFSYLTLLTYSPQFKNPKESNVKVVKDSISSEQNRADIVNNYQNRIKGISLSEAESSGKSSQDNSFLKESKALSSFSSLNNKNLKNKIKRVDDLLALGKKWEARNLLENLLKSNPNNTSLLLDLSSMYKNEFNDLTLASQTLENSLRIKPSQPEAITEMIAIYDELDQIELGTQILQSIFDQNPQNTDLALGIGHSFLIQDKFDEAIYYYEQFRQGKQDSEEVLVGLAFAYSQTKRFEESLPLYQRVAQKSLENFKIYEASNELDSQSLIQAREDLKEKYLEYWVAAQKTGNEDAMVEAQRTLEKVFLE